MTNKQFTNNVGQKFNQDGSVKTFPGNTIICMVEPGSRVYTELVKVRDMLQKMPGADKYTFMPPASYHMTVIEGVCDQVRKEGYWSKYLSLDAPLEQVDLFFTEKFSAVRLPESFAMEAEYLNVAKGISVRLSPKTEHDALELKRFRDEVSEQLGLRFPNHDHYHFHITLAYKIIELTEYEQTGVLEYKDLIDRYLKDHFGIFETSFPKLLFFQNMYSFNEERSS